jgi:hypothetical protein
MNENEINEFMGRYILRLLHEREKVIVDLNKIFLERNLKLLFRKN